MNLTREEQETFLRTNDANPGEWEFFTLSPRFAAKLEKLGYVLSKDHQGGWSCTIQGCYVTIRKPKKRVLSDKQRQNIKFAQQKRRELSVTQASRTPEGTSPENHNTAVTSGE